MFSGRTMIRFKSLKLLMFLTPLSLLGCLDGRGDQVSPASVDQPKSGEGRFNLSTSPITVIDSVTGQVWKAAGPAGGPYYFVPICYLGKDGKTLMTTPYEDNLGKKQDTSIIQFSAK